MLRECATPTSRAIDSDLEPLSFAYWGIDLTDSFPTSIWQMEYAIVATNYFNMWMEAKILVPIVKAKITNFVWRSIVCQFGIPYAHITNNDKQFNNA